MEFAATILQLPTRYQAAFNALNCEKMLPSITKFDEAEATPASSVFEEAIAAIYIFAVSPPATLEKYAALKDELEALWPDLDETKNDFASYAFDAFGAIVEALNFVLSGDAAHAVNCSTAVLDTVDMYVQMASESEPPAMVAELEAFIQASPFMIRENKRQAMLLEELANTPVINSSSLSYLRKLNGQEPLIDFAFL